MMTKSSLCMALSAVFLVGPLTYGGPLDLSVVPADVKMVVHFDAEAFRQTEMGKFVQERMERDNARELEEMVKRAGFDLRSDFTGFTMYADGASKEGGQGVMLVEGAFNHDKLMSLAIENDTYGSMAYGLETVHHWKDGAKQVFAYLSRDNKHMVLADSDKQLHRAIDTLLKKHTTLQDENPNALPLDQAGQGFLFAGAAGFNKMKGLKAQAAILKSARNAAVQVREEAGSLQGQLSVQALDADTAETMQDLADGLLAFGQTQAGDDPMAKVLLGAMTTQVVTDTLGVSFEHKVDTLMKMVSEMADREGGRRNRR